MNVYDVANPAPVAAGPQKYGFAALGQGDFLRLMTEQMKSQDPFNPVDNTQMLAQMAQFSQLAGVNDVNKTLTTLGDKLDAILAAQKAVIPAGASTDAQAANTTTSS